MRKRHFILNPPVRASRLRHVERSCYDVYCVGTPWDSGAESSPHLEPWCRWSQRMLLNLRDWA